MRISVVTVCYNAVEAIEKTILSVLDQTYPKIEYIIIDGGSTDGTVDIIKKYTDRLAYWVSEPDKGIYDAMNKGIAVATGEYINFMNAGDTFFSPKTLADFVPLIKRDAIVAYGYSNYYLEGNTFTVRPAPITYLKKRLPFCHQACLVNTIFHKTHLFDTTFKILADYNMFYQACFRENAIFQYINICVATYDISTANASNKYYKLFIRERYRIWGIENNFFLKIPMECKLLYMRVSKFVKKILPARIVLKIMNVFEQNRLHDKR